jgi:hypothetical protein
MLSPLKLAQQSKLVLGTSGDLQEPGEDLIAQIFVNEVECGTRTMSGNHLARTLTAKCKAGYVENGRKCARLPSETVCAKSAVQIGGRAFNVDSSHQPLNASLHVFPHPGEMSGCLIRLVRVHSISVLRPITAIMPLTAAGKYVMRLECSNTTPCAFPNFGELFIRCASTHQLVAGRCQPRLSTCPTAFMLDGGTCKRAPILRVSGDTLTVDVIKTRNETVNNATLFLKLLSGQFEVQWNSSCAELWASCSASGILSPSPAAAIAVVTIQLNASGQYDDSVGSGLLRTNVTFQTSIAGLQNDIQLSFPGQYPSSPIRMRVVSHPYILHDDISLTTIDSGGLWEKSEKRSLPPKGEFLTVEWGLSIRLQVCACVCCQRPPTT